MEHLTTSMRKARTGLYRITSQHYQNRAVSSVRQYRHLPTELGKYVASAENSVLEVKRWFALGAESASFRRSDRAL